MDNSIKELPSSWALVKLGEFVENEKGKKPRNESPEKTETHPIPYIDIQAFEENIVRSWTDGIGCRKCYESDFLMVWDGSRSGLVGRGVNGALGSTLVRINFPSMVNKYAFYFLQSKYQQINTRAKGSGTPHVDPDLVWNYNFPIPPLNEQHRIVAKIEELFSELDQGINNLKTAQAQLKVYRQALLKHAFEGKLTAEWRAQNADKLESASALQQRIQYAREQRYQQQLAEWQTNGKQGSKPKAPKPITPLTPKELAEVPELPKEWTWVRLENISDAFGGYAFKSKDFVENGKYQVIKIANVKMGNLKLKSHPAFISEAEEKILNLYSLKKGDCIITLTGTRKKRDYGFVAMIKNEENLLLNQRLAAIRFYKPLLPEYFQYALCNDHFQNNFFKYETGNVGQGNVGMKAITHETIALPPVMEQEKIVEEIELRITQADNLDQTITISLQQAEALRQSILKKAFSGELVPQDPNDEPASVLLARIKELKNKEK